MIAIYGKIVNFNTESVAIYLNQTNPNYMYNRAFRIAPAYFPLIHFAFCVDGWYLSTGSCVFLKFYCMPAIHCTWIYLIIHS